MEKKYIRNVAIIAHVDHGKTTLVDQLLKKSNTLESRDVLEERAMDNNDLERERGITILAKNTAIRYKDYKINILDTPGHADFSGEVERIMKMVDGVILVVDAYEGVMPQTRFVLKQALDNNLKPIIVVNKIDKESARPEEVVEEIFELFIELEASDEQIDFKVVYASASHGSSSLSSDISTQEPNMNAILDLIISEIPEPDVNAEGSLQFQGALLDYNEYVGRMAVGKVTRGVIKNNEVVSCMRRDGSIKQFRIQKLVSFVGLQKNEVEEVYAGDIVAVAVLSDLFVGETLCNVGQEEALPPIKVSEPTVEMIFSTNDSPFSGKEGKFVTSTKVEERLFRETMRREGYEFQVAKPRAIIIEKDNIKYEPFEYVQVDVPNEYAGPVIELMGRRGGYLENMENTISQTRIIYTVPSRGLIGISTDFMTASKGFGTLSHYFLEYRPMESIAIGARKLGVLVATDQGKTTTYGIGQIEDRGVLFVEPNENVYEGQIVGECNKDMDLAVNVIKAKQMTNQRSATKDTTIVLKRPRQMGLEACMEYINDDELVEITPRSIRLRKKILNTEERKKFDSRKARENNI